MAKYSRLPVEATLDVTPFRAHVEEEKLQKFKTLLELSPIAPAVFENTNAARKYGIQREWLEKAKHTWLHEFDWRKCEDRINSFPNFKASIKNQEVEIQFLALFSEKNDAIPILFTHGWPCTSCEFLDILDLLREQYSPQDLPYHVVVPCLPGFGYSSGPPINADYGIEKAAEAMNALMVGLGFGSGYLAQGGDLGSLVSKVLALKYEACKGMHVDMVAPYLPPGQSPTSEAEKGVLEKAGEFMDTGYGYGLEQGTRPATLGFALSASPLALLSWMGEKFLEWTEVDPPLDKILEGVMLWWVTETASRGLYHSRELGTADEKPKIARASKMFQAQAPPFVAKPCGYSMFAHNIVPTPSSMASKSFNLVWYKEHERGGHFPAIERPKELLADVEEYARTVWETVRRG